MTNFFAVETVAAISQGENGFRHIFLACANEAAAKWHVETQEKARVIEVTETEHNEILAGKRNGFLPSNKLV